MSEEIEKVIGEKGKQIDFLHEIGSRMAASDPFHLVLERVVEVASDAVNCDSCFLFSLDDDDRLVLRASKNPHADAIDTLLLGIGQGITGWVAEHRETVAIGSRACEDPRFRMFNELPEDLFEAFLSGPILCRGKVVGVINLQHRKPHEHSEREIRLISTIGFLVGAEIEMARMDSERAVLEQKLETRKLMERAKGILQRDLSTDEESAYLMLQRMSRQKRKPLKDVAEAVILSDELRSRRT
jgi:signal transduction protein with GAF and PtsI domain